MLARTLAALLFFAACTPDDEERTGSAENGTTAGETVTTTTASDGSSTIRDDDDDDSTTTMGDDSTTTMGDDDDDSSSGDTGPVACMDDEDCAGMGGAQAFCVGDVCVDCNAAGGDDACAEANAGTPVCETDSGLCVQCTPDNDAACEGATPACGADFECRECVEHSECPESACKIRHESETEGSVGLGRCFDPGDVVTINAGDGDDEIADALATIIGDGDLVIILEDSGGDYNEAVSFGMGNNQDVAILAAPGQNPNWIQGSGAMGPQLTINGNGRAWLHRLEIRGNQNGGVAGVVVNGGRLHVQRSRIVANTGGGVSATTGGFAVIENSFVGGEVNDPAVLVQGGADASILYSTLVCGPTSNALSCPMAMSAGDVDVRNSLIASTGDLLPEVACEATNLTVTYTATATPAALPGMGNVGVDEFPQLTPEDWFVDVIDDFSLQNDAPALMEDVALWVAGDPATDITGVTSRPTSEGADYAGAHIP